MITARQQAVFWLLVLGVLFFFIYSVRAILLPFVVGILLAYFLDPLTLFLTKMRFPRFLAALSSLVIFFLGFSCILLLLVPVLVSQIETFLVALPGYIQELEQMIRPHVQKIQAWAGEMETGTVHERLQNLMLPVLKWTGGLIEGVWSNGLTLLNFLSLILLTPVVAFYLLRDWPKFVKQCNGLLPKQHARKIQLLMASVDQTLSGFIRGQGMVCLCLATFYGMGLSIVGLEFGLLIGIFVGLMAFIPFVGYLIGAILCISIAAVQFDHWSGLLAVMAVFAVGQVLEGYILIPKLVGKSVGLNEAWIIFSLLAGGTLMGFLGVLIAVPLASVVGVLVRFLIFEYKHSNIFNGVNTPTNISS